MNEDLISKIKDQLGYFLRTFGIAGEIVVKQSDDVLVANIVTGRPEILIGRNGQTLLAIQTVIRAMLSKNLEQQLLVVDVEGYRQKHNDQVKMMAREAALKVLASGRPYHLRPMTSFERRLVHVAVADFTDLVAESEGADLSRHIVIKPRAK